MTGPDHGAAASALGYLYQFKWALIEALEAYPAAAGRRLSIEKLDDLAWETPDGVPESLEQLKHRGPSAGPLTDMQADVWSTIEVWLDAGPADDPAGPELKLITTQVAQAGSAMEALRPTRDAAALRSERVESAVDLLEQAARDSSARGTERSRRRFLELTRARRLALMSRVSVLDGSVRIEDMGRLLVEALGQAMPSVGQDLFVDQLLGWWSRAVLRLLVDRDQTLRVDDVHAAVVGFRDQYTPDSLPRTVSQDDVRRHLAAGQGRRFARQLEWVEHTPTYIELAILDYYRAYEQRAHWQMNDLIGLDILEEFEQKLRENWARRFEEVVVELPPSATDVDKAAAGRRLLASLMQDSSILLREHYREPYFAKGTMHALADVEEVDSAIGWHPHFREHLTALLSPGAA